MTVSSPLVDAPPEPALAAAFKAEERFLWGLCYRLTGNAADADDLVQETFMRAIERPPADVDRPWRPWLVRVALNLGRDLLRRRKRRAYVGPWLPSPIETGDDEAPPAFEPTIDGQMTTEGRYDLLESVSFAFLLALEALTPQQRAVLLLADVFDYSGREIADVLGMSESNVKTTHHRARRAMAAYDHQRRPPTRTLQAQTREALGRFVSALADQDVGAVEALLTESVRTINDGAGEFFAARVPIIGRRRVARFHWNISHRHVLIQSEIRMINGLPAVVASFGDERPGEPPRTVLQCEVNEQGLITRIYGVVATRKLAAIRF